MLQPFVRVYAEREIRDTDAIIREPIPARLEQTLEFQLGDCFEAVSAGGRRQIAPPIIAVGTHVEPGFSILLKKNVKSFGIFFQPDGLSRLFRLPVVVLSHEAIPANDVLGPIMTRLYSRLGECRSFAERVAITENFLLARAKQIQDDTADAIARAAAYFFWSHGAVNVSGAACDAGLSLRQFERRFLQRTGLTPKAFARVARFQTALDTKLLWPRLRWLDIAHDLGYHDQMHMVRDFHELASAAPNQLLDSLGDGRPPAMGEFNTL